MPRLVAVLLAAVLLLLPQAAAHAQPYPSKPIRFVIPFGPGSASDALARIVGQELSQTLGQPIVVVAKPGADGALSAIEVKRSAPDGYTFLFGTNSPLAVVPNMRKEPPYDVLADFTPVTFLGDNTFFIVVHPSVPAKSIAELIAHAKANPKVLNYAAGNTYSLVATAMFAANVGIEMQAIPYKSEPDAIVDLLSGRVHLMNGTSTTIAPHAKAGNLRVLATTFHERSPLMPDVPSIVESGPAQVSDRRLVRPGRSGRPAARDRRTHAQGDGRSAGKPGCEGADAEARLRPEIIDARRSSQPT